jgi:hypothetical protein
MTDDKIALRELLEKGSDATFLREMIGFAAERLRRMGFAAPHPANARPTGAISATATAIATGRPGLAPSSFVSPSCGTADPMRR